MLNINCVCSLIDTINMEQNMTKHIFKAKQYHIYGV